MDAISEDTLGEIARRIVAEIGPKQLFIFGSRAWGTPGESSDLDLMVIVPDGQGPLRLLKRRVRQCLHDILIPIDIILEPVSLFERRCRVHASLECLVAEKGKRIHG